MKPMPSASELRIQMLLDGAMQQASLRNMHVYQCSHITHFMALSFNSCSMHIQDKCTNALVCRPEVIGEFLCITTLLKGY